MQSFYSLAGKPTAREEPAESRQHGQGQQTAQLSSARDGDGPATAALHGHPSGSVNGGVPAVNAARPPRDSAAPAQWLAQEEDDGAGRCYYGEHFPKPKAAAPPICTLPGGARRSEQAHDVDRQLREAGSLAELLAWVERRAGDLDAANVVIALSSAAKLADERTVKSLQASRGWAALLGRLLESVGCLQPRGLSMAAAALARLSWREERILAAIAQESQQKARLFGATDIAKVSWGMVKLDWGVSEAPTTWAALCKEAELKVTTGSMVDVSMTAWSFAAAGHGSTTLYSDISNAALSMLKTLPPQTLSNISWAFATAGHRDTEFFRAVAKRALELIPDFVDFDAVSLCWALARVDQVDRELFDALATRIVTMDYVKRFSTQMVSDIVGAFATARLVHQPLFDALADFIAGHRAVLTTQQVATCAWAYAVVNVRSPVVWTGLAGAAKAGKLWSYRPDELSALCWAVVRVEWHDLDLLGDMLQVASHRLDEFDSDSLVNVLSSLAKLHGMSDGVEALQASLSDLLDRVCARVRELGASPQGLGPDATREAASSFCKLGRQADAQVLLGGASTAPRHAHAHALSGADASTMPLRADAQQLPGADASRGPQQAGAQALLRADASRAPQQAGAQALLRADASSAPKQADAQDLLRAHASTASRQADARALRGADAPTAPPRAPASGEDALRTMGFQEWLQTVDPSGALASYAPVLEDNYDSVRQIVKGYSLPSPEGPTLDPRFFDDTGIVVDGHRDMLVQWFSRECGLEPPKAVAAASPGGGASDGASMSFGDWLAQVDQAGSLVVYEQTFEECFDTVSQVIRTYTQVKGSRSTLDDLLFSDIGVGSESHQQLFRKWFEQHAADPFWRSGPDQPGGGG